MKRTLLVNLFAYSLEWVLLAGLSLLADRLWNMHQDRKSELLFITGIVALGAFGDWVSGWLKSRQ